MQEVAMSPPTSLSAAATTDPQGYSSVGTAVMVLCCQCGVPIAPNAANTCASCLAGSADITHGISTEACLHQCRGCQRWHVTAGKWMACELESRELMALCLSHVSGLRNSKGASRNNKIRLVDAAWIWTEPHSMRLKVKLTVQREVQTGTILQQSFQVTFVVRNQQCVECQAVFRQGSWKSLVQVRQRVRHKRTFLYLEQLILKHNAQRGCLSIEVFRDGMDFYFPDKGKAARFISFLENVCPVKVKQSKKLISTDDKSNIANYKFTNYVEICPLCKDDLVFLSPATARSIGNISRLVLVKGISAVIHFVDPLTGQTGTMTSEAYWHSKDNAVRVLVTAARSRMARFVALDREPVYLRKNVSKRSPNRKAKTKLACLTLAREADLGANDKQCLAQSHIGYLFKSGDVCLGYDLTETCLVDDEAEVAREEGKFPDVVVVRKLYGGAAAAAEATPYHDDSKELATATANAASKQRIWQLRRLEGVEMRDGSATTRKSIRSKKKKRGNADNAADDMDEEEFMEQVEADKEMRQNMNLYKTTAVAAERNTTGQQTESMEMGCDNEDDEDDQAVKLEELLDALALDQGPDDDADAALQTAATGDEDAYFDEELFQEFTTEGVKAAADGIGYVPREDARSAKPKDTAVPVLGGVMAPAFSNGTKKDNLGPQN